jgi:hypothetical protein
MQDRLGVQLDHGALGVPEGKRADEGEPAVSAAEQIERARCERKEGREAL